MQSNPECHEFSVYLFKVNNLKKTQKLVQRLENYSLDEHVDLYLLLEILRTLNTFLSSYSLQTTDELAFVKRILKDQAVLKSFLDAFECMCMATNFKHSQLSSCFSNEQWRDSEILDLPDQEDYDLDEEASNDFVNIEQIITRWDRRRVALSSKDVQEFILKDKLLVHCITWNVEGFSPTDEKSISGLFEPVLENRPQLVVICIQELFECKVHNLTKILANNAEQEEGRAWRILLEAALKRLDPIYRFHIMETNGAVQMLIFTSLSKKDITETKTLRTNLGAIGGMVANKSAVTAQLTVRKCRVQFVGCHLESGDGSKANQSRLIQLQTILPTVVDDANGVDGNIKKSQGMISSGLGFVGGLFSFGATAEPTRVEDQPHFVFVLGDMNFRLNSDLLSVMKIINNIKHQQLRGTEMHDQLKILLKYDQLSLALQETRSLYKLKEQPIMFLPTYKMEEQADLYAREKDRVPSWTDRILTYAEDKDLMQVMEYTSMPTVYNSDHRPVYLVAQIGIEVEKEKEL